MSGADGAIRVLHVDDDADYADLVATYLEREDDRLTVLTAGDAEAGLERLADGDVDCVVSDYDMPGRDGIAFLEAVREDHPELPFILFTGKGSEEVASDAVSAGVTDYLQKGSGTGQYAVLANRIRNTVERYRSRRALEASQKRLSLFFEQSPLGVIEWDEQFDLVRINGSGEEILGYDESELRGRSWETIVPESDREAVAGVVADLLENKGGYHSINENVRGDGEVIVCEWHNRVVTDDDGSVLAVFSQFQDVTERQQRQRFLTAITEATSGEAIYFKDTAGRYQYINEAGAAVFGRDPEEVVGRRAAELYDSVEGDRLEADRRVMETEEPERYEVTRTVDGERRTFLAEKHPYYEDGELVGLVGVSRDITERKRLEEQLRGEKERFERLLEASPVGIAILDADGTITRANGRAEEVFGLDASEITGRTYDDSGWEILDEDGEPVPEAELPFARVLETGEPVFDYRHRIARPDGTERWLSVNAAPLTGEDGAVEEVVAAVADVTGRREYERAIERRNERLDRFASVVSHDLRNPLNVAQGRLELAREECDSEHLESVARSHERMAELIESLLTVARQGETAVEAASLSLATVAEECWANVDTADAELVVEAEGTVRADRSQLVQLLENLLRNSVEHGGRSVTVTVGDLPDGFYVADDGPGIPEAERGDVFDAAYSTSRDGAGFGLAIVERIAETHGWTVAATESERGGARFEITGVDPG